jgi:hypothetical protein
MVPAILTWGLDRSFLQRFQKGGLKSTGGTSGAAIGGHLWLIATCFDDWNSLQQVGSNDLNFEQTYETK